MYFSAVPDYLSAVSIDTASPGMRFGMFLRIWGEDQHPSEPLWNISDRNYGPALDRAASLSDDDRKRSKALRSRQLDLALHGLASGTLLRIEGRSVAPFTTGLGNEHPTKNGFSFLNPYGLPYLPGSGVKGVMRSAAGELGWSESQICLLFGQASGTNRDLLRGALGFWDVLPEIRADRLLVEIMTPHQRHYYAPETGRGGRAGPSCEPHESGSPDPIFFLTVPPESLFAFHVSFDRYRVAAIAAASTDSFPAPIIEAARVLIADSDAWKGLLTEAFEHAFKWMGFGAKTSVGYGAMARDEALESDASRRASEKRKHEESLLARQGLTPGQLAVYEFIDWSRQQVGKLPGGQRTPIGQGHYQQTQKFANEAAAADWPPEEKAAMADAIKEWGPKMIMLDAKDLAKRLGLARLRPPA